VCDSHKLGELSTPSLETESVYKSTALELALAPLRPWLKDSRVTELCINRPGEAWVERHALGWSCEALPFASLDWCLRFAKLVANSTRQRIDETSPLLSAALRSGERVQMVIPPATMAGHVAIAIRRPASAVWSLGELASKGMFGGGQFSQTAALQPRCRAQQEGFSEDGFVGVRDSGPVDTSVRASIDGTAAILADAVRTRLNVLVSGATGSGKTTLTKALIREIDPRERLITIEDAAELSMDSHPNSARLFYSKDGQGRASLTPRQLLESCLRLRPDRILLAELRGEEAFYYLRNVNSGHPGSITSIHASSPQGAIEQMVLLVKQSPEGRGLAREDIRELVQASVDLVVQVGRGENGERVVREMLRCGN
jgi:type IV secretion system protein VirB11